MDKNIPKIDLMDKSLMPEESGKPCISAIEKGICKADCCRIVVIPFLKLNYYGMLDKMYVKPDEIVEFYNLVYVYRDDLICVYLNQATNTCQIYDSRPQVCSAYGRRNYCRHYDKYNKFIPINKRKNLEYEKPEKLKADYHKFKEAISKGLPRIPNMKEYGELMSDATPERYLKALQLIRPDMVRDADKL